MDDDLPQEVYPLIADMRRSFERIMSILQENETRIRRGYELLQRERDAMGRELMEWHGRRGESVLPMERADNTAAFSTPSERARLIDSRTQRLDDDPVTDTPGFGGTEVTLNRSPEYCRPGPAASLERLATRPPYDSQEEEGRRRQELLSRLDSEDPHRGRDSGLLSPDRESERSYKAFVSPMRIADPCMSSRIEDDSFFGGASRTALQDELRMYSAPVARTSRTVTMERSPIIAIERPPAYSRSQSNCDTLAESDHTVTLTDSSYGRRRPGLSDRPQTVQLARSGGYASKMMARQRDAATATPRGTVAIAGDSSILDIPAQGFWIHVWPCFGTFQSTARSERVYVYAHYRHLADVLEKAAEALGCKPAPQYFFEPDGKVVRTLRQLVSGQHYLVFPSGGFYRQDAVPSALLHEIIKGAKSTLTGRAF